MVVTCNHNVSASQVDDIKVDKQECANSEKSEMDRAAGTAGDSKGKQFVENPHILVSPF